MTTPITIPKELPQHSALSFDFLREEGIKSIQQMAGNTWTDHNLHDPGITILEQLCYAITDLAYRIDYDIKDLLGEDATGSYNDLYSPATILTVNPVTVPDLRKIVMDVEGVKNAWVEKITQDPFEDNTIAENSATLIPKGLYRVLIEKEEWTYVGSELLSNVKARLQACRGVCEDFEEIRLLDPQDIRLQGAIEITDKVDDINQLVADILYRVGAHLSPRITFYTLQQLLEKGKRTEDIFDGPPLAHGFIDDEELRRHTRQEEVHASDIIREIMDEEGVVAVDSLSIASGTSMVKDWVLTLDMSKTPKLDVKETLKTLEFTVQGLKAGIDPDLVVELYNKRNEDSLSGGVLHLEERDIVLPETKNRNLADYYSIQNHFPANYGIGTSGLPDSASKKRKVQAKHLKAYLVFFEQILANYFSQVAHFGKLLGFDGEDRRTYFKKNLKDSISGLEDVLEDMPGYENYLEEAASATTPGLKRKNKFLNHLLARFSEQFTGYGMLLRDGVTTTYEVETKLITDKSNFLRDYPLVSAGRAKAYNYKQPYWGNHNISGLEKRIARKLGVEDYTRRNLGDGDTEGFHMVEHILLRPHTKDPYPFEAHYTPVAITAFENPGTPGYTRCLSPDHSLKEGEEIRIQGSVTYDGIRTVSTVAKDQFEIEAAFQDSPDGATWQRTQPDVRHFILTDPVLTFSAGSDPEHTFCHVETHNLEEEDYIEIAGTQHYDGMYPITGVTENGFEIEAPFVEEELTGRWKEEGVPADPYSLQLTFVIPKWMERYENDQLKKFVGNTIREETPAHLTVYVKWLDKPEMQRFDQAFYRFLSEVNKR